MDTTKINYLNIGLMIFSCALAFYLPFELFLFSYAVLGPLHYLTEIGWLHKRKYFTFGKQDYSMLFVLGGMILLVSYFDDILGWFSGYNEDGKLALNAGALQIVATIKKLGSTVTFLAFGAAMLMILVKNKSAKIVGYVVLVLLGLGLQDQRIYYLLFAVFLPTLVHVFLFTGAFILYGALKEKSVSGILSLVVFAFCALSFFFIIPDSSGYEVSDYVKRSYDESFLLLNYEIFKTFLPDQLSYYNIYNSSAGVVITRFIAFAYTYHYLNWFSKTSVIRWHDVPKKWLAMVILIWIVSVALYAYDYKTGLVALYFLSFLHVYLEFPLNWISFKGIGQELARLRLPARISG